MNLKEYLADPSPPRFSPGPLTDFLQPSFVQLQGHLGVYVVVRDGWWTPNGNADIPVHRVRCPELPLLKFSRDRWRLAWLRPVKAKLNAKSHRCSDVGPCSRILWRPRAIERKQQQVIDRLLSFEVQYIVHVL